MAASWKPEDVPTELIDLAMRGAKPGCRSDAAFYLANVLPDYERMVREQVAREIEKRFSILMPKHHAYDHVHESARIARGGR